MEGARAAQVPYYDYALDLILDADSPNNEILTEEQHELVESAAEMLYGLIHVRYILTSRGMAAMFEKFKNCEFGRCPRVLCNGQPCLPIGTSDVPRQATVKIFCPKCCDIFYPRSKYQARRPRRARATRALLQPARPALRQHAAPGPCLPRVPAAARRAPAPATRRRTDPHRPPPDASQRPRLTRSGGAQGNVDGVFFGTTFPHLLLMTYPSLRPPRPTETYVPRVFGFRLHESALERPPAEPAAPRQNGAPHARGPPPAAPLCTQPRAPVCAWSTRMHTVLCCKQLDGERHATRRRAMLPCLWLHSWWLCAGVSSIVWEVLQQVLQAAGGVHAFAPAERMRRP
jgi:hypothetical protein